MGSGVRHLTHHQWVSAPRGNAASWAVLEAAHRLRWWTDPMLEARPADGEPPDRATVDRAIARLAMSEPGPEALGRLYESLLDRHDRDAGAHYTPVEVAEHLVEVALAGVADSEDPSTVSVWDPTCGGGAFLLAAAEGLRRRGFDPGAVITEALWGTDIDPGAVAIAHASLRWWAASHGADIGGPGPGLAPNVDVADAFVADAPLSEGFHAVVGNPPFQGQMRGATVRTSARNRILRERWGDVVGPYTDTAALAMVVGASALRPGGRLAMVMPMSVLGTRDAAAAREAARERAELSGLWMAGEAVFDAEVDVCGIVLTEGSTSPVRRWRGRHFHRLADAEAPEPGGSWAPLAAAALGIPEPVVTTRGTVAEVAQVSAGFRDEYYGLIGHVREASASFRCDGGQADVDGTHLGLAPLITVGLIEPGRVLWGERAVHFAKERYERPVVDLDSLHAEGGRASAHVQALAVPKVLIATQTKVGEAAVDEHGSWVASTPTVAAVAPEEVLWKLAAVVCSPVGSALAAAWTAGTGRTAGSIKHSVASVKALPLPVDEAAWSDGADALRRGDRSRFVAAMADAYRLHDPDDELGRWWTARAPWTR